MRAFSWVPLLGLLAALAAAQDEALEELANSKMSVVTPDSPTPVEEEPAAHKTTGSSILETVQGIMSSLSPIGANPPSQSDGTETQGGEALAPHPAVHAEAVVEEAATTGEDPPPTTTTIAAEEATTSLGTRQEEPSDANTHKNKNKNKNKNRNGNNEKLVQRYNEVSDTVLRLLSRSLSRLEPLPITINDDIALTALEAGEPEPEPEPEPEGEKGGEAQSGNKKKKKNKTRNKNRNRNRNKNKDEDSDMEEPERNANKKNKKNKTKAAGTEEEEQEEEIQIRPGKNKNRNKKNKNKRNKNRNKRKNNRKNRRNKKNKSGMENSRDGRDMFDEDGEDEDAFYGRRNSAPERKNKKNNRNNKKGKRRNKNRKNRNNNNKKNRKNQPKGTVESREDSGPVYPSMEERELSNAFITGLTSLTRDGDVTVDTSTNAILVDVNVHVGPLYVQLADSARALTKSQVSTTLKADMQFRIKNKGRGRQLIKLTNLNLAGPEEVNVARLDLPLEPEVVSAAQDQVREALDVPRLGRIFRRQLETIFGEDNVVQNLEHHDLLKNE